MMRFAALLVVVLLASAPASAGGAGGDIPSRIAGRYEPAHEFPHVFTTRAQLDDIVRRVGRPGSFSAAEFANLGKLVARDLASRNDWSAAYSGCKINDYLYGFSFADAHSARVDALRTDMGLPAGTTPPIGAAIIASRDALYAALVRAGARPADGASATDATALSRKILIAWANHGFRADGDRYYSSNTQFCNDDGAHVPGATSAVGLQVSRGVLYSVAAQDLLESIHALDGDDIPALNRFHRAMYVLIRNAMNATAGGLPCNRYGNHRANDLAALLAIARLVDDQRAFEAALYGNDPRLPVRISWVAFFERNVYGRDDVPNKCYPNTGPDGSTSRPFFQTAVVAPGEIDDRFRNKDADQGIGYPMFSLQRLLNAAEVMRNAGLDAYAYHGARGQSLRMALEYYACYGVHAGYGSQVTEANSAACPDVAQYVGKTVLGSQEILFGSARFPDDAAIGRAATAARTSPSVMDGDALFFGHWRD